MEIYEYEIQAMKEAGFNYVGLQLDFSWLLGGLNRPNTNDGMMDAECLRKLDQILAWCMERDMHLDIRCISVGGFVYSQQACWTPDENGARRYAEVWEVLANRYRDIPNTYLSFTVLDQVFQNWGNQSDGGFVFEANMRWLKQRQAVDFLKPAVEAIRSVTPDRCIIADLSSFFGSGDDILELNVAISTDIYAENRFFLPLKNDVEDPSYFSSLQWPYEGTVDAQAMLEGVFFYNARSVNELSAFAREHGLGFMVSGWGMFPLSSPYYPAYRISDETYHAFLTDMTQALEGTSWCYENRYGTSGITTAVPLVKNVTYEQMEDYPLYYDTAMLGWFQEINGVT